MWTENTPVASGWVRPGYLKLRSEQRIEPSRRRQPIPVHQPPLVYEQGEIGTGQLTQADFHQSRSGSLRDALRDGLWDDAGQGRDK
jgi:hypothetical protein